ncbi:ApeP family dehydratase [Gilvimarinus agarilyticus]|uniref:ApeP family dehydratase n=1 Tax=Gilvimarinus agarilyticus TaxID=679259 RepID=UPI0005A13E71|nr:hypothetical protein [Gilvimarinus agarilyticus]
MSLADYLPHQPPMRLIDTLVNNSHRDVEVLAHINSDNVFYDAVRGGVPAWAGIEYMAQAAAAWVGLEDTQAGRAIDPAFLISSRQYTAHQPLFVLNTTLRVVVHADLIDGSLVAFTGCIYHGTELMAEAVFTAYRPDDVAAYMAATEPALQSTGDRMNNVRSKP